MRGFDTHIHTTASDGLYTVPEIVRMAGEQELQGIAITDHDTVSALAEAERVAKEQCFHIIPGIELSAEYEENDVHILGYFIDRNDKELLSRLQALREHRRTRVLQMLEKLTQNGMPIDAAEIVIAEGQTAGRPHLARAMAAKGYVKDEKEAFAKWLGRGKPCFVEREKLSPFEAIELVRKAGGVPCLAHPGLGVPDELIGELAAHGLQGIEIYHPEHKISDERKYYAVAQQYGLICLGGSDFHGTGDKAVGLKFTSAEQAEALYKKAGRRI